MSLGSLRQQLEASGKGRLSPQQFIAVTAFMVAGALLFCGPTRTELGQGSLLVSASVATYSVVMLVISVAVVLLRQESAKSLQVYATHVTARPWLGAWADGVCAIVMTASSLLLCTYMFGHETDFRVWIGSLLYFGLVALCMRLLRERNNVRQVAENPRNAAMPVSPGDLLYVEAEDHYVKLVYKDRVEHKRARFSDMTARLGNAGLRVHKSFWVNGQFVTGTRRAGRRLVLVLKDGVEIPVGRSSERKVVDALSALRGGIRATPEPRRA